MTSDDPETFSLSTITATYERPKDTAALLQSLHRSLTAFKSTHSETDISCSFIVVCPETDEETLTTLKALDIPNLNLMAVQGERVADNRDRAIRAADTEYVAIVDSDCRVTRDWFEEIYLSLRTNDPDVIQGGYFFDYLPTRNWVTETETIQDRQRFDEGELDSRNLVFRRKTYFAMGGYGRGKQDAGYGDDQILNFRLREVDANVVRRPSARVYHKYPTNVTGNLDRYYRYGRGAWYVREEFPNLSDHHFTLLSGVHYVYLNLINIVSGTDDDRTRLQSVYILLTTLSLMWGYASARTERLMDHV